MRKYVGGIMAPINAFLLHQGLQTLPMRMERHCTNAMKVAGFLDDHPMVKRVHYPGLPDDPGHKVANRQVKGFGGMLGIELEGNKKFTSLDTVKQKTSLGPGWSTMCNSPLRMHKTWVHDGGACTPLIVHWPSGIQARGELRRDPGHVIDLLLTVEELEARWESILADIRAVAPVKDEDFHSVKVTDH